MQSKYKWDNASFFIIDKNKVSFLRDLETTIVRFAKPKYNKQKGRVRDEHYLKRFLRNKVKKNRKKLQKQEREEDEKLQGLKDTIEKIEKVLKQNSKK
ncbi:MAG: hypothetical protein HY917_04685 [Candidatus Diapherotrites archaeon]|nr:hypothetical protein [Candidatus Diapherotrites archaeon]